MNEEEKRDLLMAEWILKVTVLERVLISKGLITAEDISNIAEEVLEKMSNFQNIAQQMDKQDKEG